VHGSLAATHRIARRTATGNVRNLHLRDDREGDVETGYCLLNAEGAPVRAQLGVHPCQGKSRRAVTRQGKARTPAYAGRALPLLWPPQLAAQRAAHNSVHGWSLREAEVMIFRMTPLPRCSERAGLSQPAFARSKGQHHVQNWLVAPVRPYAVSSIVNGLSTPWLFTMPEIGTAGCDHESETL